MLTFVLLNPPVVVPQTAQRVEDQINSQCNEAEVQEQQRQEPVRDLMNFIGPGSGDQHA